MRKALCMCIYKLTYKNPLKTTNIGHFGLAKLILRFDYETGKEIVPQCVCILSIQCPTVLAAPSLRHEPTKPAFLSTTNILYCPETGILKNNTSFCDKVEKVRASSALHS